MENLENGKSIENKLAIIEYDLIKELKGIRWALEDLADILRNNL